MQLLESGICKRQVKCKMLPPKDYLESLHSDPIVRDFLHKLYSLTGRSANTRKELLSSASVAQLDFTIKTLHYIMDKQIRVPIQHMKALSSSKKIPHLKAHFQKRMTANALIRGSRSKKIDALAPINCYHILFFYLFNKRSATKKD